MRVEYEDGTQVPVQRQAVYLGSIITNQSEYEPELNHRIAVTAKRSQELKCTMAEGTSQHEMENPCF